MSEIFATRKDWLIKACEMNVMDILTIHPKDDLTSKIVYDALKAQGYFKGWPHKSGFKSKWFVFDHHGNKFFIQRTH